MSFKVINNLDEYKEFMDSVYDSFGCHEYWEHFFGINPPLKYNEDTGEVLETIFEYEGEIRCKPEIFPCVLFIILEDDNDLRHGNLRVEVFDYISLEDINKQLK